MGRGQGEVDMEIEYKKKKIDQKRALNFTVDLFFLPKEDLVLYKPEDSFLPLLIFLSPRGQKAAAFNSTQLCYIPPVF